MAEYMQRKRCVKALMCMTVSELVCLLGLAVYWREMRKQLLTPKQQQMCFASIKFISSEENKTCLDGLRESFDEKRNVTMCCGNSDVIFTELTNKVAHDRYNSDINPEMTGLNLTAFNCEITEEERPVASLVGLATDRNPVLVGKSFKLFWNSLSPSHALFGLRYLTTDGSIYVEQTGFYFVFSQIKMKLEQAPNTSHTVDETVNHSIHLISNTEGEARTLLEHSKSPCELVTIESHATVGTGGVFKLERGDRLYVATSHPEHVTFDRTNNYFSINSI